MVLKRKWAPSFAPIGIMGFYLIQDSLKIKPVMFHLQMLMLKLCTGNRDNCIDKQYNRINTHKKTQKKVDYQNDQIL